jgi:signal transduction histidine kinase
MEPTDLGALVRDATSALRPVATQKGLSLLVDAELPIWVLGEPGLLRQLVTNLTENAIKFTPSGTVRVSLGRFSERARIEVSDTGAGIPADALPYVFERFYRADPARSRTVEGTGLGLAVVRNIVRVHNGWITVSSEQGKGSTFVVEIPTLDELREEAAS